mmetsp:Transcript_46125/g.128284  ORF Transcript_46125/g.128284 Transcript_46125/m.128284 type:complete len:288 (-) Transcript_46125:154-1017(-)
MLGGRQCSAQRGRAFSQGHAIVASVVAAASLLLFAAGFGLRWGGSAYSTRERSHNGLAIAPPAALPLSRRSPRPTRCDGDGEFKVMLPKVLVDHVMKQCESAFHEVDHDNSGSLDIAELHIAVLLVYRGLNRALGMPHFAPPRRAEVCALHAQGDDGDGGLTLREFQDVFIERLLPRVAAKAFSRLVTLRLVVPWTAVGLNLATARLHVASHLEELVAQSGTGNGLQRFVARSVRRAVSQKVFPKLCSAVGPVVNMCVAKAAVQCAHIEDHIFATVCGMWSARSGSS